MGKKAMTEQEWLAGAIPAAMVSFLRQRRASERKLRLFGCACCRRVWHLLPNEASRKAVDVAERFADGLAKRKDLKTAEMACQEEANESTHNNPGETVVRLGTLMPAFWTSYNARCLVEGPQFFDASQIPVREIAHEVEGRGQIGLLHDIFGNPFHPVSLDPACRSWNGGILLKLAQAAYDERQLPTGHLDPARLTVLA